MYPINIAKMSFDQILALTAVFYFLFLYMHVVYVLRTQFIANVPINTCWGTGLPIVYTHACLTRAKIPAMLKKKKITKNYLGKRKRHGTRRRILETEI